MQRLRHLVQLAHAPIEAGECDAEPSTMHQRNAAHAAAQVALGAAFINTIARSLFADANTIRVCSWAMLAVA